jgi:hypothetical protein
MEEATARIASKLQVQYHECPTVSGSFGGPDPDPHVFGLLDPDPLLRGTDPDPSLFS